MPVLKCWRFLLPNFLSRELLRWCSAHSCQILTEIQYAQASCASLTWSPCFPQQLQSSCTGTFEQGLRTLAFNNYAVWQFCRQLKTFPDELKIPKNRWNLLTNKVESFQTIWKVSWQAGKLPDYLNFLT